MQFVAINMPHKLFFKSYLHKGSRKDS
jgi:hypothetical protein